MIRTWQPLMAAIQMKTLGCWPAMRMHSQPQEEKKRSLTYTEEKLPPMNQVRKIGCLSKMFPSRQSLRNLLPGYWARSQQFSPNEVKVTHYFENAPFNSCLPNQVSTSQLCPPARHLSPGQINDNQPVYTISWI